MMKSNMVRYLRRVRPGTGEEPVRPRCAWVLSGGGVYGAEQVGMMRALVEAGHAPELISAVSVGALNGAALAADPDLAGIERLEAVWRSAESRDLFPGSRFEKAMAMVRRRESICDNSGMKRLIERSVRVEVFEDLRIPFFVTATELNTGAHRTFSSGPIRNVLLATTALPGVFPPVDVDGALMVDGGLVSNIPTAPAVAARPERLFVLDVSKPLGRTPATPLGMIFHAFQITRHLVADRDLEAARMLSGAVVLPRPDDEPAVGFDDLSKTQELMAAGYERTRRFLESEFSAVA
jgi:NTE family protein